MADLLTEATGSREVPQPPRQVWQALAVLQPYCAVCDVSYVVTGRGVGTTFVCVPGRLDGAEPPATALRGEIVDWAPPRVVTTRLVRAGETWTTRMELAGTPAGGTRVDLRLTREAAGSSRLVRAVQRRSAERLVQRTVDAELDRLPAHLDQAGG